MPATTDAPNRHARRHPESQSPRRWAGIPTTAEYLGVTDRTIRQMIADGRLTAYRNGNRFIRLDLNEVDDAMTPFGGAV